MKKAFRSYVWLDTDTLSDAKEIDGDPYTYGAHVSATIHELLLERESYSLLTDRLGFDGDICRGCGVDRTGDWQGRHGSGCWVATAHKGNSTQ